ncbi:hypothetical protein [Puia dinghuensis]|uniref:Uncharacterized protein n=1 Tax=Puia dinghuensis TaxID=1792502 RepID=A0A8J2UEW0_9BACT|nr:hypothetical protein [Puia dinghuensis]GGB06693.1 hypothetical protein GCM10011511_32700 [Puia dinghuensis]
MEQLTRQLRLLRRYVAVLTVVLIGCIIAIIFLARHGYQFGELTAQRINIVEPDGRLALVISDHARQHPGRIDGKDIPPRDRPAGLIYFNEEGDECGGYSWDGNKTFNSMSLTADQYKNDQIMALDYEDDRGATPSRLYGFRLWDRSDSFTLGKQLAYIDSLRRLHDTSAYRAGMGFLQKQVVDRLFLGRTPDGSTGLFLRDDKGIPRLRIYISKQNEPVIETLNEKGEVVHSAVNH